MSAAVELFFVALPVPVGSTEDSYTFLERAGAELIQQGSDRTFLTPDAAALMIESGAHLQRVAQEIESLRRERGVARAKERAYLELIRPMLDQARCVSAMGGKLEARAERVLRTAGAGV